MVCRTDQAERQVRRRRVRRTLGIGLVLAATGLWLSQVGRVRLMPAERAPAAAALEFLDAQGRTARLVELRGKVVLLHLWASWCAPCRVEIPRLNRLQREFAPRGLVVLGVSVEELDAASLNAMQRELQIEYRVALPRSPLAGSLAPTATLPQMWLIDREGRVRASPVGLVPERGLRNACDRLLSENGSSDTGNAG